MLRCLWSSVCGLLAAVLLLTGTANQTKPKANHILQGLEFRVHSPMELVLIFLLLVSSPLQSSTYSTTIMSAIPFRFSCERSVQANPREGGLSGVSPRDLTLNHKLGVYGLGSPKPYNHLGWVRRNIPGFLPFSLSLLNGCKFPVPLDVWKSFIPFSSKPQTLSSKPRTPDKVSTSLVPQGGWVRCVDAYAWRWRSAAWGDSGLVYCLALPKLIPRCKRGGAKTPVLRNWAYAVSIFVLGRVRGSDFRRSSVVCLME